MGDQKFEIPGQYYQTEEKPLGKGGMGIVYLVFSMREKREVALKLMTEYFTDTRMAQKALENFRQEAEITKRIKHKHILSAFDSGETPYHGRLTPYLVSEYKPEGSLQDFLSKTKILPWKDWELLQIADLIMQAASALQCLHVQNPRIAHRDVKPGNFLIEREKGAGNKYHLYLCDFGIARRQKTLNDLTSDPHFTPSYAAPEQFTEDGHYRIDYRSDQYSLAVMACYLLTGQYPIRASDPVTLAIAHKEKKPPIPPSTLNPERITPGEIDDVILKALANDPNERHSSIQVFANNLHDAIERQIQATSVRKQSHLSSITLEPFKPYTDDESEADTISASSQIQVQAPPTRMQERLPSLNLQHVFSRQLPARPTMLTWSWDGKYLLCLFNNQSPMLVDRNNTLWDLSPLGLGHAACWTPDPNVIVLSAKLNEGREKQHLLRVCNLRDVLTLEEDSLSFPEISRSVSSFDAFDVSRRRLLAVWVEDHIDMYQLPRWSSSMQRPSPHAYQMKDMYSDSTGVLSWSPDGSMLAMGALNGAILCWRLNTQPAQWHQQLQEPACQQRVCSLAWSMDSKFLAAAFSDRRILVWNVLERRKMTEWKNLSIRPHSISISNQQQLTVASSEAYVLSGNLGESSPSAMHQGYWFAAWSPAYYEFATLDPTNKKDLMIWRA